jgi:hypothetical protein
MEADDGFLRAAGGRRAPVGPTTMTRRIATMAGLIAAIAATLATVGIAYATADRTMKLTVAAGQKASATEPMPTHVRALAATVNGKDATYERVTACLAYVYGRGVVARLNACARSWQLDVTNASRRSATVRVTVR